MVRFAERVRAVFLAHIVGVPVEETALSLAPVAFATGGMAAVGLRRLARMRPWRREASPAEGRR